MTNLPLQARVERLETEVRRWRRVVTLVALAGMVGMGVGARAGQSPSVIRVRGVVVIDSAGRERIFIGAPVPDPSEGRRSSPSVGLTVNDTNGYERFGFGLQESGRFVMGFDAPPGTGDDRNRERITLVADDGGGAYIRFLDRRTRAQAFLRLGEDNAAYLDFLNWTDGSIHTRRFGFGVDTILTQAR